MFPRLRAVETFWETMFPHVWAPLGLLGIKEGLVRVHFTEPCGDTFCGRVQFDSISKFDR